MKKIMLKPIGIVESEYYGQYTSDQAKKNISKIIIYPDYIEGLYRLEEYSHIYVIFYCNQLREELGKPLKVNIKGDVNLPKVGIFASRAQNRPNPIGLTVVKLINIKDNILFVKGLDAYNNSLIIDIKPLIPLSDIPKNPKALKF